MASGDDPRVYDIATETANDKVDSDALRAQINADSGVVTTLARIRTGGGNLYLYGATPWTAGAEITALDGVVLAHTGNPIAPPRDASSVTDTQNTSNEYVPMDSMSLTPGAGTYIVRFSTSVENTKNNAKTFMCLYVAGNPVGSTRRHSRRGGGQGNVQDIISTDARVTVEDGESIEVHWKVTAGTGTAHERTLILQEVD